MLTILILTAALAAPAAFAQVPGARTASEDTVLVSRRALTISLALDSAAMASTPEGRWSASSLVRILDADPRSWGIRLMVTQPRTMPADRSVPHPETCSVSASAASCRDSTTFDISPHRLIVTVRDSALLAWVFADRPTAMALQLPSGLSRVRPPVVRYVEPQLLPPPKNALVDEDLALARAGWSPWTRMMWTESHGAIDTVWMQVGARTEATVAELQVRPIDSQNRRSDFSASGWTSSDSSVAALEPTDDPRRVSVTIVAVRPGRSTVTVEGLHGPSDDLPRSARIRTLARHIVVTNRLVRVEITPRLATIVAGSRLPLTARVIDERGVVVPGPPINFYSIYDSPDKYGWEGKRYDLAERADLTTLGHRRFIAIFAGLADTLDVQVVAAKPKPRERR